MRSAPRRLSDPSRLYNLALRALMRRAHSVHELKTYLERRAQNPEQVPRIIERLKELHYLDDARYARDYARVHGPGRKQGKFRIARELRARGVPDELIRSALQTLFAETDERALVRSRIEAKLRSFDGTLDERKRASLYRSLLRAGFSADTIRAEIGFAARAGLIVVSDPRPDEDS